MIQCACKNNATWGTSGGLNALFPLKPWDVLCTLVTGKRPSYFFVRAEENSSTMDFRDRRVAKRTKRDFWIKNK